VRSITFGTPFVYVYDFKRYANLHNRDVLRGSVIRTKNRPEPMRATAMSRAGTGNDVRREKFTVFPGTRAIKAERSSRKDREGLNKQNPTRFPHTTLYPSDYVARVCVRTYGGDFIRPAARLAADKHRTQTLLGEQNSFAKSLHYTRYTAGGEQVRLWCDRRSKASNQKWRSRVENKIYTRRAREFRNTCRHGSDETTRRMSLSLARAFIVLSKPSHW